MRRRAGSLAGSGCRLRVYRAFLSRRPAVAHLKAVLLLQHLSGPMRLGLGTPAPPAASAGGPGLRGVRAVELEGARVSRSTFHRAPCRLLYSCGAGCVGWIF
jgi:hypothetical protein